MAEIKSTMDLVLERAARIGKASSEELHLEESRKKGIQLAVEFMEGRLEDPLQEVTKQEQKTQTAVLKGMAETMLRNIFLPRDEIQQSRAERALNGLMGLAGGSGGAASVCSELANILSGYMQHREQLRNQLEEQIKMQYENLMAQQQQMQRGGSQVDQNLQLKFQEEWSRVETELNAQYGNAMDQLKQQIGQRFGIA